MRPYLRSALEINLIKSFPDDSCEAFIPCFSSLSRCLSVMTAIRLTRPGLCRGAFLWPP
ncbi:hypothetical protein RA210_U60218 [Rubrivivax sp. A210]|nr:hypothetical protein RA210_U60218 [Rubrivivax sp. A210]